MLEYLFRLSRPDGPLVLEPAAACANDAEAANVPRWLLSRHPTRSRVKIWLGSRCPNVGIQATWPYASASRERRSQ